MTSAVQMLIDALPSAEIDCGVRGLFSGRDIHARVLALAERLRHTCPRDRPVAVALDQGLENCVADLAPLAAELPALPLPPFFSEQQRVHAMQAAGAVACLVVEAERDDSFQILTLSNAKQKLPEGTGKISFTSGSTGTPKGICLSAEHLVGVAQSVVARLGQGHAGRHLALLPPAVQREAAQLALNMTPHLAPRCGAIVPDATIVDSVCPPLQNGDTGTAHPCSLRHMGGDESMLFELGWFCSCVRWFCTRV